MKLRVRPSHLAGSIAVPGSKSHTIRAIVAALQAEGRSVLRAPLDSGDTRSVLEAAKRFGAKVAEYPDRWEITGCGGRLRDPGQIVQMNNSGTGLRMLTALAAMQDFPIRFDGDDSLRSRPMSGLFAPLRELGAQIDADRDRCPFTIRGPLHGGKCSVDGKSSQYLTALLFALPRAAEPSSLALSYLNERPYVEMTLRWLKELGLCVAHTDDMLAWETPGDQRFFPFDRVIPADFSTAAFALAAGALHGGPLAIANLDFSDTQGDKALFGFYEQMGCRIEYGNVTTVCAKAQRGVTLDLNATPDALPILAATAPFLSGETRLVNVPQARFKECDRIAVMTAELRKLGADVAELADGMVIRPSPLHGGETDSHGDHRIAMALAIAGTLIDGETVIGHAEGIPVSYPGFIADFRALGADFTLC